VAERIIQDTTVDVRLGFVPYQQLEKERIVRELKLEKPTNQLTPGQIFELRRLEGLVSNRHAGVARHLAPAGQSNTV
jgi:hypothetical protein